MKPRRWERLLKGKLPQDLLQHLQNTGQPLSFPKSFQALTKEFKARVVCALYGVDHPTLLVLYDRVFLRAVSLDLTRHKASQKSLGLLTLRCSHQQLQEVCTAAQRERLGNDNEVDNIYYNWVHWLCRTAENPALAHYDAANVVYGLQRTDVVVPRPNLRGLT
jgi:hypothetical protein